ncbi:hypothetical protein ACQUJS_18800 [Ralstonia pseudosolanacearum]|uniref:Uncharacterized protein n=1 Tax=Ralstonia solanacearum TaxID=305 RepID=A0A0S4TPS6_RALSL|nr:hypothetical protein [Ralstonia pseudosolanacearum]CUV12059.1 protein of unknown function [Ralstonia solanacearum]
MIAANRKPPPGKGAFLLPPNLGAADRMETRADHQRAAMKARAFFSEFATEKPALSMVETLHQSKQDDYAVRHAGKRRRDLFTDKPLSGDDSRIGAQKPSSQFST